MNRDDRAGDGLFIEDEVIFTYTEGIEPTIEEIILSFDAETVCPPGK